MVDYEALRAREFGRLDRDGDVYLDYTGTALYPDSLIDANAAFLRGHLLGNPHSAHPASTLSSSLIDHARDAVLSFFGADPAEYAVIFAANASAAIKLVAESFPFGPGSRLLLSRDNHNSVNGIGAFARRAGADLVTLPLDQQLRIPADVALPPPGRGPSLFALPAQSNFSGVRHPERLTATATDLGYQVLLDIAALAPTSPCDLGRWRPDFATVSFYKMFGFPGGVGALIARHGALERLRRPWFAGGTVDFVSTEHQLHQLRQGVLAFEDGTPNFPAAAGIINGLSFLRQLGMTAVSDRLAGLTTDLLSRFGELRHSNGRAVIAVYGPTDGRDRGATIAFNLLDPAGEVHPYQAIETDAAERRIHVRGGCFCNPGAAETAFQFAPGRSRACLQQLTPGRFDLARLADCLGPGVAVGALRVSLGLPTVARDLDRLVDWLRAYRDRPRGQPALALSA
jgi:selenocysteine lyase/cysteine desulfurase